MTVSSLWKALNKGGCGKPVGEKEITSGKTKADFARINPWNYNKQTPSNTQTLAVDLSIWICESLTSYGMSEQNVNPALHLVFSRTVKLLNLGVKLVIVIEGKSRVRTEMGEDDRFRKRRSGTSFWKACNDCQKMLELLGVPVVRAKAEGEALCALLNQRGIVDGVISNDGDCLLFGAKVIYTKYSNENLDNGSVVRYDLYDLRVIAENNDDHDDKNEADHPMSGEIMLLSRQDLIAFALLTGSDLAGSGLAKVGHKKAIRFIRKCKTDNPLCPETAALGEMQAWARAASAEGIMEQHIDEEDENESEQKKKSKNCCSRCCHAGSKRNHLKHGCELCGTEPGEACYKVTSDDRFRKSLRAKALAMQPKFEPSKVHHSYMMPNDNQIPFQFVNVKSSDLKMSPPQLRALLQMNLIVKGQNIATSRAYLKQAIGRILSRAELCQPHASGPHALGQGNSKRLPRDRPIPKLVQKALVQKEVPCFEILWCVNATVTDENGEGMDGYEYVTIEPRELVEQRYPQLINDFQEAEKERQKQGDAEKERRQGFLETFLFGNPDGGDPNNRNVAAKRKGATEKARDTFFQTNVPRQMTNKSHDVTKLRTGGDDVANLLQFASRQPKGSPNRREQLTVSTLHRSPMTTKGCTPVAKPAKRSRIFDHAKENQLPFLTPSKELFCDMGDLMVALTPIASNQGAFPPRNVYVDRRKKSGH